MAASSIQQKACKSEISSLALDLSSLAARMYNGRDATRLYFESSECCISSSSSSSPVPKFEVVAIVNQCELAAFAYWSITDVLGSAHFVYLLPHYSSSKLIWAVGVDVSCEVEGKRTESGIELGTQKGEAVVLRSRARENPGFVPGFEHSVNAEQGSMGAGAGAAAAIDHNEPSPHGTAIEKVLAELRSDLAVREERRRELEFLEKGGEPLDFQFREVRSLTFSSPSPAEPLADQLLFSHGDVGSVAKAISNGNAHESISSRALSRGRGVELEDCSFPVNARDAKDGTPSKGRSPQPSISNSAWTQINVTTKREGEGEGSEGDHIGSRSPEYARRNKYQSQHLGNGHLSVKEQEKLVGVYSSLVVAQPPQPPVTTKDEAMVDMGFQVLPHESPHAVTDNYNGVPTNQELEPLIKVMRRCGVDLEQHMADTSTDIEKDTNRAVLTSHVSLQSEDTSVNFQVATGEDDGSQFTGKGSNIDLFFSEERPSPYVRSFHELQEADAACLQEHVDDKSLLGRDSVNPGSAREPSATGHSGHETPRQETEERVGTRPLPHLDSIEKCSSRAHQVASEVGLNMPPRGSMYEQNLSSKEVTGTEGKTLPVTQVMLEGLEGGSFHKCPKIKKKVARGTSDVRKVNRDWSAQDDKRLNASNVRIKVEDVAEDRTKPSATMSELSSLQVSGAPKPQELRTEGQAGAVVGGVPRSIGRTSSTSALLKNKFPGVVIPWEKEHDPTVQAEAEKHRADISAKARKAHEDIILEEAEHLQAASSTTVDHVLNKPWCEASRKKAHWDFVLEEMAWMANDFVQESLWKRAATAQICRCVALQKRQHEFLASQLCKRQRKVAKVLANLVNGFWHSVEVLLIKQKVGISNLVKTQTQASNSSSKDFDGAVPMDVDFPGMEIADIGSDKVNKQKSTAIIQQYAMPFLKSSGFELMLQPEAPATPKRHSESNSTILEPFWEDQFPEEPLFYVVSNGSMEVYRASVESDCTMLEAKHVLELASEHDAEVQAVPGVAEDAAVCSDFGTDGYGNDGSSQDDELQSHFMLSSLGSGGGLPGIVKKKRKKIAKVNTAGPKLEVGASLPGFVYWPSMSGGDRGSPSLAITGKRSLSGYSDSTNIPGIIPTKRARSSAVNLRQRGGGASPSPGTVEHFARTTVGSHFQQDERMDMLNGCHRGDNNSDTPSNNLNAVGSDGTFVTSKLKKNKRIKHSLEGACATRQDEAGVSGSVSIKGSERDHGQQDLQPTYELMKKKVNHLLPPCIAASETGPGIADDAAETPGLPGLKKSKVAKQSSDGNTEGIPGPIRPASQTGQRSVVLDGNKLITQNSNCDRNNRKSKGSKGLLLIASAGISIPWSSVEDQAILVVVHDLGPNWELVSDVLSCNSQLKGIYRKPHQCRERHKFLFERLETDIQENSHDLSPLQSSNAQPAGIPKGNNARVLLQQIHGAVEEDTLKVHLEQIVLTWEKLCPQKATDAQEQKFPATPHPSHGIAISQFCTGGPPNPLDLCDRVIANGEIPPHSFTMQAHSPHGNGPALPSGGLHRGASMWPPSSGMPPDLPGSNGIPLGPLMGLSSAAINAAAARDAQRFTAMRLSPEETNRLQMATTGSLGAYNRRLQQQAVSATTGLPVLGGLPNPSDLSLLPSSTASGMLGGLNRSMSLPRLGLPGMDSAPVSSTGAASLCTMLPPGGVNMVSSRSLPSGSVSGQFLTWRMRDALQQLQMGACSEEQRMQLLQQLQNEASQGDAQAAAALTSLKSGMAMVSSPPQSFSPQHQQQQHQALQQRNQLQQQLQLQNLQTQQHQQAWEVQVAHAKEHQRQQQFQKQKQLLGALPTLPQPQLHTPNPHHQQMLEFPHQPYMPGLSSQNMGPQSQHIISQQSHILQKQLVERQQVGGPSQVPRSSPPSSSLQSAPVSPAGPRSSSRMCQQQQQPLPQQNQVTGHIPQIFGPAKLEQAKHFQKQQQASRVSKGLSCEPMMMQGLPQSTNTLTGNVSIGCNQMPGDLSGQPGLHPLQQAQRVLQAQGQMHSGKLQPWSQQGVSGHQLQSQGAQLQGGAQSQGLDFVPGHQKEHQHQQGVQVVVPKQQHTPLFQQQAQPAPLTQQSAAQQQLPLSAPVLQSQLQPPALEQEQSQKKQCQPMQQQQEPPPQRRLQMLHPGTAMGMPLPGQLGKVGMQQQGQGISSHMASQPGTPPYQHGNTSSIGTTSSTSCPGPHIMPLSSGLKLSTAGVHALDWKSNQAAPPMSGGMFNLTCTSSPGSPTLAPSGVNMPSASGNKGMSIHGASMGGVPQAHAVIQGVQGQKFAISPGPNGRGITGSQQGTSAKQRSQQGSMPVSIAMSNMLASQTPPPVQSSSSGMLPSSTVSLATSGPLNVAYQGVPAGGQGHSASLPGSGLLYSIQPHQPQICSMLSTGTAVYERSADPASSGPALTAISTVGSTSPSVTSVVAGSSSSA